MEALFIILFLAVINWLQWVDRRKQQSIIRNFKSGNQVTHTEYLLFEVALQVLVYPKKNARFLSDLKY
jgi:hypothetical protein